jgi:hypothetical protein
MDEQRLFIISSVQQARKATFAGPKYEPWLRPGNHSLPPAEVPQKKAVKPERARLPVSEKPNMERVIGPSGRAKWVLSSAVVAEVRARLIAGDSIKVISIATGVGVNAVYRESRGMRKERTAAAEMVMAAEKEKGTEVPLSVLPMPCPTVPSLTTPSPAGPRPASPAMPFPAIVESKADESTMFTTWEPQEVYQEPVRTFILDWATRMTAYSFSDPPTGCLPRKGRSHSKGGSADFREVYPWPYTVTPMTINPRHPLAINCAAPELTPTLANTKEHIKPSKQPKTACNSVGPKAGKDVEFQTKWREICTT